MPEPLDPQLPQDAEPAAEPTGLEPVVAGDELRMLIAQLEDLDTVAVNRAARQLAEMGPPAEAAVPGLLRQLVYHPVRSDARQALVRVATPRSLPILAAALVQKEIAWDVAALLESIGPPAIPMLVSAAVGGGPDAQLPAFGALAAILAAHPYDAGPAVPMLLAALRRDRPDIPTIAAEILGRVGAADHTLAARIAPVLAAEWAAGPARPLSVALVRLGPPAVPVLIPLLSHADADIRCGAAGMLGDIGPAAAEAAPALAGLLDDNRTRDAAEAALEQISQDPESHGC